MCSEGNLVNVKSDSVYRKIRSEHLSKNDRHEDDIIDLLLMHRENTNYVYSVGEPFFVHIFSREQLNLIVKEGLAVNSHPILHLDSTGTIIRRPKSTKKKYFIMRVLYELKLIECVPFWNW